MRQQINLYQPIFSEERKLFSAIGAAAALAVLLVVLAAFSVSAHLRVRSLSNQVEILRAHQSEQQSLLEGGEAESPAAVQTSVEHLERVVAERGRALEILRSGAAGKTLGFAPRLEALSRRHLDGVWIESIRLSGMNGAMTLSGATLNPDLVSAYLRSLAQDPVLAGTRFDDFIIERPAADAAEDETQSATNSDTPKKYDPKLVRFRAGSSALKVADVEEPS